MQSISNETMQFAQQYKQMQIMFLSFLFYQSIFKGWNLKSCEDILEVRLTMMEFFQEVMPSWYNMLTFHHNEWYDIIQVQLQEHCVCGMIGSGFRLSWY